MNDKKNIFADVTIETRVLSLILDSDLAEPEKTFAKGFDSITSNNRSIHTSNETFCLSKIDQYIGKTWVLCTQFCFYVTGLITHPVNAAYT